MSVSLGTALPVSLGYGTIRHSNLQELTAKQREVEIKAKSAAEQGNECCRVRQRGQQSEAKSVS